MYIYFIIFTYLKMSKYSIKNVFIMVFSFKIYYLKCILNSVFFVKIKYF